MEAPKEIFLADYKVPDYFFDTVDLKFVLGDDKTIVLAKTVVQPRIEGIDQPLILNGSDLKLISMKVNGKQVEKGGFQLTPRSLTLVSPPTSVFTLEIETEIYPQHNTSLEGLYKSSGNFCTQCEAEGFRKITFYQDRPDILAKFTTRVEADKTLFPVLLSNGNLIEQGDLKDGRHYAVWEDPFKKPCYLFALVAGQLVSRNDTFITRSGRQVSLRIWTPADDIPKTAHAMYSLKAIRSKLTFLRTIMRGKDICKLVCVNSWVLNAAEEKLKSVISLLQKLGIEGQELSELLEKQPRLLTCSEEKLMESFKQAEYIGFKKGSKMFAAALRSLLGVGKENFDRRLQYLINLGFSEKQVSTLVSRQPSILSLSEETLKPKVDFLVESAGLPLAELVKYPTLLGYSLEKRMIPRFRVWEALKSMQEQGVKREGLFSSIAILSEKRFLDKYVNSNAKSFGLRGINHSAKLET